MPISADFTASRNVTWAPTLAYEYPGAALPLTGAHIAMQLRLYGGAAGDALLTLNPIAFTDAIALDDTGAQLTDDDGNLLRVLTLSPVVTPTQWATLPGLNTPEAGDPQLFAFDIRITYADGVSELLHLGAFNLLPGVTTV